MAAVNLNCVNNFVFKVLVVTEERREALMLFTDC